MMHMCSLLSYTVLSSYNCTHACDFSRGTTRICNCGPREFKAVIHDHEWLKSMHGLKPRVV